ncbi:unnamed protein product [Cuscuta campestris]|uniref:Uncharacterized protein n=1 Tax=Cuscuta campestris TaxID=132261 RepID=A0A484MTU4_9ASTE|nr:unnamed protein product [Cuscuta campestris]
MAMAICIKAVSHFSKVNIMCMHVCYHTLIIKIKNMGQSANKSATGGAPRPNTGSRGACRSVNHAVQSAGACLPEPPATKKNALATTTGRPRKEALNALNPPGGSSDYLP